jgi:hypothetical protein
MDSIKNYGIDGLGGVKVKFGGKVCEILVKIARKSKGLS